MVALPSRIKDQEQGGLKLIPRTGVCCLHEKRGPWAPSRWCAPGESPKQMDLVPSIYCLFILGYWAILGTFEGPKAGSGAKARRGA